MRNILERLLREPFEEPRVQTDRQTQSLRFDNFHVQSSMRKNAPLELDLAYTRITTIEIDERVIALRDQFVIPQDSDRFRVIHADAAEYLSGKNDVADIILLDGFDGYGLPFNLSTQCFYDDCYAALRHEGVVVANLLDNDAQLENCIYRIRHACDGKLLRTSVRRERHTIALGLKQQNIPEWQHMYRNAKEIDQSMGLELSRYVKKIEPFE